MEELLNTWNIPLEVIELFCKNGIEINHLCQLNDEYLKELCPMMGVRINLKKKINEFIDAQATTESEVNTDSLDAEECAVGDLTINLTDLFPLIPQFQDFDLKTLLETSPCGKSILQYYTTNGSLDTKRRNRLTDIIIRHLFTFIVNKRLTYDDYNILFGKIITLFPQESASTYFTRPIKKSESHKGKSVAAKGKLIDRVRNLLFQSGESKRKASVTVDNEDITEHQLRKRKAIETVDDNKDTEQYEEDVDWLKQHKEPWSEVLSKWKNTAQFRHGKDYSTVGHFMAEWNILNCPRSVELIDEDFSFLYPDKHNNLKKNWQPFCQKLFQIKKSEVKTDQYKEDLLTSLASLNTDEEKIPTQLTLLVHLVPPKGRTSKKKKFSIRECLESIMIIVDNPGDINRTLEERKKQAQSQKAQVQPYLILLGSVQNCHQFYLVIDEIKYTFDSAINAFDTLFKSYHVFNAKYNPASDHIMLIIQRCVYEITTKYDNPVPYISDILRLAV